MKPFLWPAKMHSMERTKATMAQAIGKRAVIRIFGVAAELDMVSSVVVVGLELIEELWVFEIMLS